VPAVVVEVVFGGADDDVEVETDMGTGEPGGIVCGEADGVIACFVRGKCEAAFRGAFCFCDYVARLYFFDFNNYTKSWMVDVLLSGLRPFEGVVVTFDDGV